MSSRAFRRASIPTALALLAATTSLWAQSPIISQAGIGPTVEETGTEDPFPSPRFGTKVAICGRIAMASIPGDLASEPNEFGRVAVFEKTNTEWARTATLIGTPEAGGIFGSRIDIEGNRAVIGGPKAIYLFERRKSGWAQTAKVVLTSADTFFGKDIDLHRGEIFASVEHQNGDTVVRQINVYAHIRQGTLSRTAFIRPRSGLDDGGFGSSLHADGGLLVVGAPSDIAPGAAYVYSRSASRWFRADRLMASDATADDAFGASVAIRAGVIVVGAPRADLGLPEEGTGPLRGNVYVFRPAQYGWYESQKINETWMEYPHVGVGQNVSMGRGMLALFQNDNRFLIRNTQRALVYDWVDGSFQINREVISNEDGRVPDLDMAGRSLIVSLQVLPGGVGYYYVQGAADIFEFGPYEH
jgi:hypothetical protein